MKRYFLFVAAAGLAVGCILWPRKAASHETVTTTVLFDREIVRILDKHCIMCHVDNGPAFPMVTYEQTYNLRRKMRMDALSGQMAPWAGVSGYGHFANNNQLTRREIDFIVSWAEGWGPRNAGAVYNSTADGKAPPPPVQAHIDFDHWELGKPDLLLALPPNHVEAKPEEQIVRTVIDPKLTSDRWLSGLEYKPGDRRVVRAVDFTLEKSGLWIGSWTPWYGYSSLPKGLAYRLPAGSHVVAEIHYFGAKDAVEDRGSLGLHFTDQAPSNPVDDIVLEPKSQAASGSAAHNLRASFKLAADTNILALNPAVGRGVKSIEVSALTPDGKTQVLLFAKDFQTAWPTPYIAESPVALPKGSTVSVSEYYAGDAAPVASVPLTISSYDGPAAAAATPPPAAPAKRYKLVGTVRSIDAKGRAMVIQHSAIPGYMGAMTMSYDAGPQEDLTKISVGDQIQADLVVNSDTDMHLEKITVTGHSN